MDFLKPQTALERSSVAQVALPDDETSNPLSEWREEAEALGFVAPTELEMNGDGENLIVRERTRNAPLRVTSSCALPIDLLCITALPTSLRPNSFGLFSRAC